MSEVVRMPIGRDPVWLNDFEYLVRWKGRVVRVDVRDLRPVGISDELIRESTVSLSDVFDRFR